MDSSISIPFLVLEPYLYALFIIQIKKFGHRCTLNVANTTSVLIGTKKALRDKSKGEPLRMGFKISGELSEQRTCVKYLGILIDNQLKWKDHVSSVSSRVSRAIGMIKCAKKFLRIDTLNLLYPGMIEPHLRFCCSVWGSCGVTTRRILEGLQNRSVRITTKLFIRNLQAWYIKQ